MKKFSAGSNKTGSGQDAAKLDRETEELHHDRSYTTYTTLSLNQRRLDPRDRLSAFLVNT